MNNFKIGDLVVCVNYHFSKFTIGKIYKIKKIVNTNYKIYVEKNDKNEVDWFYGDCFRFPTSVELRKYEGFSKELEELINE